MLSGLSSDWVFHKDAKMITKLIPRKVFFTGGVGTHSVNLELQQFLQYEHQYIPLIASEPIYGHHSGNIKTVYHAVNFRFFALTQTWQIGAP